MIEVLGGAFATGLLGSAHCVGMCGGFAAACGARHGVRGTVLYSLGRLTTYAALGASAGALGAALQGLRWVGLALSAVLLVYFAGRLAGLVPGRSVHLPGLSRLARWAARAPGGVGRLAFGAANGLLPCGLVYAALALPVAAGTPAGGALTMAAFGLGTVPAMAAVGLTARRLGAATRGVRIALAVGVLVVGGLALVARAPRSEAPATCCVDSR